MPANSSTEKTVLITGCSPGGIGHALATEFLAKGLNVIATARDRRKIADLEAVGIITLSLDVTSVDSIHAARKKVEEVTGGRLDILVNNAGINYTMPALDIELDVARAVFETNFFGIVAMTQGFAPLLMAAKGLMINIGSCGAIFPYVFGSAYNASKAALHAYSRAVRLELAPFGVRVMVVVSGGVQTNIAHVDRVLPESSLYLEIKEDFKRRVSHSQDGAIPAKVYAQGVVREALRSNTRRTYWRGNKWWLVWFGRNWIGSWVFDLFLPRMFGLHKLAGLLKAKEKLM